ncbi:MAG: UDP-3-O-(3-hydroxymyristoyl)glucosamine N-acyltransferase [Saprospiraceae bacterium]|nr:UDP-3-O-(3-hydroxymyristoyl)glucosamine N-acyltransferase [Saprospiraceae bacterium]
MKMTAAQIANFIGGTVEGDSNASVSRGAPIEAAQSGDFTFLDNPKYEDFAYSTKASILLVNNEFKPVKPVSPTLVRTADVRSSLAILLKIIDQANHANGAAISEKAHIHAEAKIGAGTEVGVFAVIEQGAVIGKNCKIHPQVFIGKNARIGDNCVLFPGVRIHFDCEIGNNCILHANAVIGADGFGFAPQKDGTWTKIPQVGKVVLEDNVEVGASTCIDRASLGSTIIHSGAKLDNLIHIAHNVEVGHNSVLAAQVGVAGSTHLGNSMRVGGQAGFAGHLKIADGTQIQAQSGLASNVESPGTALFGSPAIGYRDFIKSHVVFKQLPDLQRKVLDLERKLAEMMNGKAD